MDTDIKLFNRSFNYNRVSCQGIEKYIIYKNSNLHNGILLQGFLERECKQSDNLSDVAIEYMRMETME